MIAGLRLRKTAARLINACVTVFDDGLPDHPVNREHRPALRLAEQRAIARRIGLRRVDVSGSQIALRNQEIKSEQSALALVGERRQLFAYQRLGVLLLPGVVKLPYQQLLVAASQVLVVSA